MIRSDSLPPKRQLIAIAAVALIVVVVMPWMHASGSLPGHKLELYGKYLCFASLAVSLNLLWGYTGLLCLGQCMFFALGGYAFGMHLMLKIGVDPVYKSPLPDFMDFQGYHELPAHWAPFESFGFAAAAVLCVPALVALVFGFLVFRSRITGVYFAIITQALTYAAWILFLRNEFTFGGNNGFTKFNTVLGTSINSPGAERTLFILSGLLMIAVVILATVLTRTRFGKIQKAIRDSENRVRFSGYCTENFKLFIFVLSAVIAGIAGALYVPQAGIINPDIMKPVQSLEVVVWVAVGGRATVWGPVIGAIAVNALKSWATVVFPDYWLIILGGAFVVIVLFLPGGIISLGGKLSELKEAFLARRKRVAQSDQEETPAAS
jgi:urea transport system permease protein